MNGEELAKFKSSCKDYLASLGITDLRAYGRDVGVERPTTKKKEELVEEITAILAGELSSIDRSTRGAPVKNDFVDPRIPERIEEIKRTCFTATENYAESDEDDTGFDFQAELKRVKEKNYGRLVLESPDRPHDGQIRRGQYEKINGVDWLLPLDSRDQRSERIVVPPELVEKHALREGDTVSCYARRGQKFLVAARIVTVNELRDGRERVWFDEAPAGYPCGRIRFGDDPKNDSATLKYLDWLMPFGRGQRACVLSAPKAGKSTMLYQIAARASEVNPDLLTLVLLVDQSPEQITRFSRVVPLDNLVYTTYEDEAEKQVFTAEFILKRAKRYAEYGRDVLLVVDSLSALARAYNETEDSAGGKVLAGGLESKTLHYIKRYFGAARRLENGGSLTIVGAVNSATGNPADDLISAELSSVANLEIRLSDSLAFRRVYPALDHLHSHVSSEGAEMEIDSVLRGKLLPANGDEWLVKLLTSACSFEEFSAKIKKSE